VDATATTALATLLGGATGGLTSVLATWLAHRTQARAQWLEQDTLRKQDPYKEFIESAARCYVHGAPARRSRYSRPCRPLRQD
jgi:hypothetical protein